MSLANVKLHLVETFEDACQAMRWFEDGPRKSSLNAIGVDSETTGFKWHGRDYVRTVQVGDDEHGWMIPRDTWWGLFVDMVQQHTGPIDMMNAKFDWPFLRKAGIELDRSRIRDVGVMSHILEPHMSRALKNQAKRHVDPTADAGQHDLAEAMAQGGWTWETMPWDHPAYWVYGAMDPVLTYQLRQHHLPLVEAQAPKAYEIESAFQWVALNAETHGVPIDVENARASQEKFDKYCDEVEKWCKDEFNIKPGSNRAVIEKLQEAGFEFGKQTASGALSLDADVLEGIDHPLAQAVLRRRQLQKLSSTYLNFYLANTTAAGLIHPSINTLGTRTSRMSMNDPNFQNLPRVNEGKPAVKAIRNCVAARPGYTLVFCDLDQIEMRGLAIMSEDPGLIRAFNSPDDFFISLARTVFQDPTISIKKDPRRQIVKNVGYAKIYGAGVARLAITAGIPFPMAQEANSNFDFAYPGAKNWLSQTYQEAMSRINVDGYAWTECPLTGRRHPAERGKEYALANYKIQGWAAALFKLLMLRLDAAGLGEYMILFVHDEVILEVPDEDVRDIVKTLQSVMNDATMFPVPISAGVATGKRWGEKIDWVNE